MRPSKSLCAMIIATGICVVNNPSLAADCAQGDALSCYTQALVRLQAAEDALTAARNEIGGLQSSIDTLTAKVKTLTDSSDAMKQELSQTRDFLSFVYAPSCPLGKDIGGVFALHDDHESVPTGFNPSVAPDHKAAGMDLHSWLSLRICKGPPWCNSRVIRFRPPAKRSGCALWRPLRRSPDRSLHQK